MTGLCRKFGISRQTGYKWVKRWRDFGCCDDALVEFCRTPHSHPWATDPDVVDLLVRTRKARPRWGPLKLRSWLMERDPKLELPAPSTIGSILKKHGLTNRRTRRRRTPASVEPLSRCDAPNAVWCTDFKGDFRIGSGERVYPLTLMDAHSRFLIRCEALENTSSEACLPIFESAFREFGLPESIRSDNGSPFASKGAGGLTALSAWWAKLGIRHERIEPGKPQQNGRHERMHRTLKAETAMPPRSSWRAQQRAFDRFRKEYNEERPHESLGNKTPASRYVGSSRSLERSPDRMEYPFGDLVLRLDKLGRTKLGRRTVHVSKALAHEYVLFERIDDHCWELHYGDVLLGYFDLTKTGHSLVQPGRNRK